MPRHRIVPVKFGGSILTDKAGDAGVRTDRLDDVARAIAALDEGCRKRLVIILGGGSIGHRAAVRYGLAEGAVVAERLYRMSREMFLLKCAMADALERCGIAAFPFHEGSTVLADRATNSLSAGAIRAALAGNFVPILSGGPVLSAAGSAIAFNSDRLGHALLASGEFEFNRFVLCSGTPGVFGKDGRPIAVLTEANREAVDDLGLARSVVDVSGGMLAKVAIVLDLARYGVESIICGTAALAPDRFTGVLAGTVSEGTRIAAWRRPLPVTAAVGGPETLSLQVGLSQ